MIQPLCQLLQPLAMLRQRPFQIKFLAKIAQSMHENNNKSPFINSLHPLIRGNAESRFDMQKWKIEKLLHVDEKHIVIFICHIVQVPVDGLLRVIAAVHRNPNLTTLLCHGPILQQEIDRRFRQCELRNWTWVSLANENLRYVWLAVALTSCDRRAQWTCFKACCSCDTLLSGRWELG